MKKAIIALVAILMVVPAYAGEYRPRNHRHSNNNNWVAPLVGGLIIGGIIGSSSARSRNYYYEDYDYYETPVCWSRYLGRDYYGRPMYQRVCR